MNRQTTITLTELDLRRAVRLQMFKGIRKPPLLVRLAMIWFITTSVAAGSFLVLRDSWSQLSRDILPLSLFFATVVLGVIVLRFGMSLFAIRRRFRQEKLIRQPALISWSLEAFEVEQPGVHSRIPWCDYTKICENRHLFMFFPSDYLYQILPKRVLSQEQIEDLQRIIATRQDAALQTPPDRGLWHQWTHWS